MSASQRVIKRVTDIIVSAAGLILFFPLILYVAVRVRFSSPGPVLYSQERVGQNGRIFRIRKFRSMFVNAEANGPRLSQESDNRITPYGRVIRKWKLDELPQFWNVLIGDMSLVGPRPERQYYIHILEQRGISYSALLKVKPGITSLGMVNFGYASSIEDIMERLKIDVYYLQNFSLALDVKIMLRTLRIIFRANGR